MYSYIRIVYNTDIREYIRVCTVYVFVYYQFITMVMYLQVHCTQYIVNESIISCAIAVVENVST